MQDEQGIVRAAAVQAEPVMLDLEGGINKTQALTLVRPVVGVNFYEW